MRPLVCSYVYIITVGGKGTMQHSLSANENVSLGASPNNFVGLGSNIYQAAVQKAIII